MSQTSGRLGTKVLPLWLQQQTQCGVRARVWLMLFCSGLVCCSVGMFGESLRTPLLELPTCCLPGHLESSVFEESPHLLQTTAAKQICCLWKKGHILPLGHVLTHIIWTHHWIDTIQGLREKDDKGRYVLTVRTEEEKGKIEESRELAEERRPEEGKRWASRADVSSDTGWMFKGVLGHWVWQQRRHYV